MRAFPAAGDAGVHGPKERGPNGPPGGPSATNSTNVQSQLCSAPHVSRTDEKGPGAWPEEARGALKPAEETGPRGVSSAGSLGAQSPASQPRGGCEAVYDEGERTRLMADILRLLRDPHVPQGARVAGLTLIGWLARRRPDETPHAIGVDEARESERRMKSARSKTR
jgi:hypothetical protein